jgi:hypothetical protein
MAIDDQGERKVDPASGNKNRFELGDSKDTVLEGVDGDQYDVFTETAKLAKARAKQRDYNWFVSFVIKKKGETRSTGDALNYMVKFDRPGKDEDPVRVYYYLDDTDTVHEVTDYQTEDNRGKKRIRFTLTTGDPPLSTVP